MTTSEMIDGANFEKQENPEVTLDMVFPHVIEEGGYVPPKEGDWAHIGQSGNVLFGIRNEDGKLTKKDAITVESIKAINFALAHRVSNASTDMIYDAGSERVKLRTSVRQQEILDVVSKIVINGSRMVG